MIPGEFSRWKGTLRLRGLKWGREPGLLEKKPTSRTLQNTDGIKMIKERWSILVGHVGNLSMWEAEAGRSL